MSNVEDLNRWLVVNFTHPMMILEFILENPIGDMRKVVVGVLTQALKNTWRQRGLKEDMSDEGVCILRGFAHNLLRMVSIANR